MTKKYWVPEERSRFELRGQPPMDWVKKSLEALPFILMLVGPFGAGKTFVSSMLYLLGDSLPVKKAILRPKQTTERNAVLPMRQMSYRKWLENEKAVFEAPIIGLLPPYLEWDYWGEKLRVKPPTYEEFWPIAEIKRLHIIEQFVASFWLDDIAGTVNRAKKEGKFVTHELRQGHAEDFIDLYVRFAGEKALEKILIVELEASIETRTKRQIRRAQTRATNDPLEDVVTRAKIVEGASMRTGLPGPKGVQKITISNESEGMIDRLDLVEDIRRIIKGNLGRLAA